MHSGYFRGTALENKVLEIVRMIHNAGGTAVEFMPAQLQALSSDERQEFLELMNETDMELIIGAGRSPATDPSSPDPEVRAAAFTFAQQTMKLLHDFGCHKWDGLIHACWPGKPTGTLTPEAKAATLAQSAESMRLLMPLAEEYEIDLCFEVVNRFEHYLLNTAEEALAFCEMIDHPRAKVLLDVFHMNIEEDDIGAAISSVGRAQRLGHFHVGEANRSVPGTVFSHLNWEMIFSSLHDCGYTGTVILEPFILGGTAYATNVCLWRDLSRGASFAQYLENIRTGISFIRSFWF